MNFEKNSVKYKVENGALLGVPVYEEHKRGKNWLAIIKLDPSSPAGLARKFLPRAKGEYYYFLEKGIYPVEFGADYYTTSGHKSPNRVYGVIVWDGGPEAEFIQCSTAKEAIKLAEELNKSRTEPAS